MYIHKKIFLVMQILVLVSMSLQASDEQNKRQSSLLIRRAVSTLAITPACNCATEMKDLSARRQLVISVVRRNGASLDLAKVLDERIAKVGRTTPGHHALHNFTLGSFSVNPSTKVNNHHHNAVTDAAVDIMIKQGVDGVLARIVQSGVRPDDSAHRALQNIIDHDNKTHQATLVVVPSSGVSAVVPPSTVTVSSSPSLSTSHPWSAQYTRALWITGAIGIGLFGAYQVKKIVQRRWKSRHVNKHSPSSVVLAHR